MEGSLLRLMTSPIPDPACNSRAPGVVPGAWIRQRQRSHAIAISRLGMPQRLAADSCENRSFVQHGKRSEEHTSELQSLMRTSYAVVCLKKKNYTSHNQTT